MELKCRKWSCWLGWGGKFVRSNSSHFMLHYQHDGTPSVRVMSTSHLEPDIITVHMRLISLFNDLHICVSALLLLMLGVANLSAGLVVRTLLPFLCWVTVRLFYNPADFLQGLITLISLGWAALWLLHQLDLIKTWCKASQQGTTWGGSPLQICRIGTSLF